jgi:plasmid stabilization system protein ParE
MSARKPTRPAIVLTDEAQDDLLNISLYGMLTWGEEQADRYHAGIADALESVRRFPRVGREVSGFGTGVWSCVGSVDTR